MIIWIQGSFDMPKLTKLINQRTASRTITQVSVIPISVPALLIYYLWD